MARVVLLVLRWLGRGRGSGGLQAFHYAVLRTEYRFKARKGPPITSSCFPSTQS